MEAKLTIVRVCIHNLLTFVIRNYSDNQTVKEHILQSRFFVVIPQLVIRHRFGFNRT